MSKLWLLLAIVVFLVRMIWRYVFFGWLISKEKPELPKLPGRID